MPVARASKDVDNFLSEIRNFDKFGRRTAEENVGGIPHFINEFWTSRQRKSRRIQEVSYRACFKPQLPAFFITRLSERDDVVYDPFMGRGTTAIEAAAQGRIPYGNDINPLSRILVKPRIHSPHMQEIAERLREIPWQSFVDYDRNDLLVFFHPLTLACIEGLRRYLLEREASGQLDEVDAWIRMIAVSRLTGHSPGFFSVYTLPPNQAVSIRSQERINLRRNQVPTYRSVPDLILRKSESLLSQGGVRVGSDLFLCEHAHHTPQIGDASVKLVVTSPPFLDIVSYSKDNWMRCWFIGVDPDSIDMNVHSSIDRWQDFVHRTLEELSRILVPKGHIAFEVGEVRNGNVLLDEYVIAAARNTCLNVLGVMINSQEFTKTSNCWGMSNNFRGTNSNRIVLMRKA